ncbi:MAG: sugar ABC transporter permease [Coriobacteriales bacterium]|jgi:putative spermidine/putrescine transport system permease protein|nr:sugar ABC transporter permease [Coriobacteriales bacterium]
MKTKLLLIASFVPVFTLMALAYVVPLASNLMQSFQDKSGRFVGIDNYVSVLTSYYFLDSLLYTLKIALLSTAIAMVIAIIVALALRETFLGKKLVVFMFQLNLTIPRMAAAMIAIMLLSQTGFISQIARSLGIISEAKQFPWLVFDSGGLGVVIAFVWKFFPYIGLSVLSVLQGSSREYEDQAATLGVGVFRRFWHVTLPLIIPATSIATIIVFAAAFGDYELPTILGNSTHHVLSVYTYLKYCDSALFNPPEAYVLMIIMSLILAVVILFYRKLTMAE